MVFSVRNCSFGNCAFSDSGSGFCGTSTDTISSGLLTHSKDDCFMLSNDMLLFCSSSFVLSDIHFLYSRSGVSLKKNKNKIIIII